LYFGFEINFLVPILLLFLTEKKYLTENFMSYG
jgi:hypothetical protein